MLASSEMQAIASEIFLALGDNYVEHAKAVLEHDAWWDFLPKEDRSPESFSTADEYFRHAVATGLFKTFQDFPSDSLAKKANAKRKWHDAEKQCYRTNRRFYSYLDDAQSYLALPSTIREFLSELRKEVKRILGPVPNHVSPKFGPGTTADTRGAIACTVPSKIGAPPSMTSSAWPFLRSWGETLWGRRHRNTLGEAWGWVGQDDIHDPIIIDGNRYDTVPKNRDSDRSIAIEPALNLFYQLGYGAHIKTRLRRYGQLLSPTVDFLTGRSNAWTSKERHMAAARQASITGDFATIDLSSASDTVATAFVEWCLGDCPEWFSILNSLRPPKTIIDGAPYVLEKFSSMGNGYTFELETLLFFCICRVVLRLTGLQSHVDNVLTFGDDIIVPSSSYRSVVAALRFCGFTPNPRKSFGTGPFRESCGGDYFRGVDVRPPNISGAPKCPADWIVVHNQLERLRGRVDDTHLDNAEGICINNIPVEYRLYGPEVLGDSVLHGSSELWWTSMRPYKGEGRLSRGGSRIQHIKVLRTIPVSHSWLRWDSLSAAISRVYGIQGSRVSLRGEPEGWIPAWVPLPGGFSQ